MDFLRVDFRVYAFFCQSLSQQTFTRFLKNCNTIVQKEGGGGGSAAFGTMLKKPALFNWEGFKLDDLLFVLFLL